MRGCEDMRDEPTFFSKEIKGCDQVGTYWSLLKHNDAVLLSTYHPETGKLDEDALPHGGIQGFYHPLENVRRLGSSQAKFLVDPCILSHHEVWPLSILLFDSRENLVCMGERGYLSKEMPQVLSNFTFPQRRKAFKSKLYEGVYHESHFRARRGMMLNPVAEIGQVLAALRAKKLVGCPGVQDLPRAPKVAPAAGLVLALAMSERHVGQYVGSHIPESLAAGMSVVDPLFYLEQMMGVGAGFSWGFDQASIFNPIGLDPEFGWSYPAHPIWTAGSAIVNAEIDKEKLRLKGGCSAIPRGPKW
jgi:hypothetical protein